MILLLKKKKDNFNIVLHHIPPNNSLLDIFTSLYESLAAVFSLQSGCPDRASLGATALLSHAAQENYICFLKSEELVPLRHSVPTSC